MELIAMVLVPFPLGFLVRNRLAAFVAYVAVHSFLFTFQTLVLVRQWAGGSFTAFEQDPAAVPLSYGVVNLVIYAVGLGLVWLGHRLGAHRRARRDAPVDLAA